MIFGKKDKKDKLDIISDDVKKVIKKLKEDTTVRFYNNTDEKLDNILSKLSKIEKSCNTTESFINAICDLFKKSNSVALEAEERIEKLSDLLRECEKEKRSKNSKIGGLTKSNNALKIELKKANEKIANLEFELDNSYKLTKLPSEKNRNTQKLKIKNHVKSSQAKAILRDKTEQEVN